LCAKELWETTMDPTSRVLLQVTLDDAATDHMVAMARLLVHSNVRRAANLGSSAGQDLVVGHRAALGGYVATEASCARATCWSSSRSSHLVHTAPIM